MAFMAYEGLKDGGTFRLDTATTGKVKTNPKQIVGKVVAFVAPENNEPTVGYGSKNNLVAGVVTAVEQEETGSDKFVVTVSWSNTFANVSTTETIAVAGAGVAVDGKGGVVTNAATTNAICMAVASGNETCTIRVL